MPADVFGELNLVAIMGLHYCQDSKSFSALILSLTREWTLFQRPRIFVVIIPYHDLPMVGGAVCVTRSCSSKFSSLNSRLAFPTGIHYSGLLLSFWLDLAI